MLGIYASIATPAVLDRGLRHVPLQPAYRIATSTMFHEAGNLFLKRDSS